MTQRNQEETQKTNLEQGTKRLEDCPSEAVWMKSLNLAQILDWLWSPVGSSLN
jgi:hypothetical protein